jgi:hypothetical protein
MTKIKNVSQRDVLDSDYIAYAKKNISLTRRSTMRSQKHLTARLAKTILIAREGLHRSIQQRNQTHIPAPRVARSATNSCPPQWLGLSKAGRELFADFQVKP